MKRKFQPLVLFVKVLVLLLSMLFFYAFTTNNVYEKEIIVKKQYLIVPVNPEIGTKGADSKLWIKIGEQEIGPYVFKMPERAEDVKHYAFLPLEKFKGKTVEIRIMGGSTEVFDLIEQSNKIPGQKKFYKEAYRPQFHFSSKMGWLNDPNGLIYHNGTYHLYYQYNPFSVYWGNITWGHAVSKDLIRWEEKPAVLFPSEQGTCYSGATFIDRQNQLGLQKDKEDVIVAFYLRTKIGLSYAYSNDGGYSFTEYKGNPVLSHDGARIDTPRPFWYEPTKRWIAPTYDFFDNEKGEKRRCVGFYSSENLTDWTFESRVEQDGWGDELCGCVDFFQLPVDGDSNNKKWVMIFIDGSYIIGNFDGHTFFNKDGKPASTHERNEALVIDQNFYATMTWYNMPDNRRVQITWMRGEHFPEMPFGQQMTLPSELSLHTTEHGLQLRMNPIEEFESLRTKTHKFQNINLSKNGNPLSGIAGDLFDLEIEFEPTDGSETIFDMRGIAIKYNADTQMLSCGPAITKLEPIDGKIGLRIIQDRTCVEVYGNDGRVYVPLVQAPEEDKLQLKAYCDKGEIKVGYLRVHELKSAW